MNIALCRHLTVWVLLLGSTGLSAQILLEPGKKMERQLSGGESHEYGNALQAGQYARVVVEQRTVNVAAACFGSDGQKLLEADSDQIGDPKAIELIGETSGTYRLQVKPAEPHAPGGRYEITLEEIAAATDRHRMRVAAAREFAQGMTLSRQGPREATVQS